MRYAYKEYGMNDRGIPTVYPQEILILRDDELTPQNYIESTKEDIDLIIAEHQSTVNQIIQQEQEEQRLATTFKMNNSSSIDENQDFTILNYIKKEVGLENNNTIVKEWYESFENNQYNNLIIREEKEYEKLNNSPLFNNEILRIKYYLLNGQVGYTKTIETPLSLGYSMSITARMQELKVIKAEEYIVSEIGIENGLPIHISLLNEIKQYERLDVMPLYNAIQNLQSLTQPQKDVVNSILFS